jgi:hypothetical protein
MFAPGDSAVNERRAALHSLATRDGRRRSPTALPQAMEPETRRLAIPDPGILL